VVGGAARVKVAAVWRRPPFSADLNAGTARLRLACLLRPC